MLITLNKKLHNVWKEKTDKIIKTKDKTEIFEALNKIFSLKKKTRIKKMTKLQ